jgi:hypothetical protein
LRSRLRSVIPVLAILALAGGPAFAGDKLTAEQRVELIRGLTAEYATAKVMLPRSKKALKVESTGQYDKAQWSDAARENGPAARAGDMVQITKVDIGSDRIEFDLNGGFNAGKPKWYQRIQVGVGNNTAPISQQQGSNAPAGTSMVLLFHGTPPANVAEIKKMLAPLLDFEKHTVTENYVDSLPPEMQKAIKEKRAITGMDRDQVLLALGRPVRKIRQTVDGVETEDWVYGTPPGKIVFVTFEGKTVAKVKEDYAGLGTQARDPGPIR